MENFMYQLVQNKIIDHNIVMVNMKNEHGNSSIVKFGSWDTSTLKPGKSLMMFPSKNT
jgi:hypothetical protein